MNRKNLTAAVLAGLAGVAGIAGTAQAVNMNPDGLGQVLIYPYYTSNDGNQTLLSVVNTTAEAKAVKVRFLEGFNSREVLDFNLYMSREDVWVAAIADDEGTPTLYIPDTSCTVPYLYGDSIEDGEMMGVQPFLKLAYAGDFNDGGPEGIERAAEGHFEMIEMGTLTGAAAAAATHDNSEDGDGMPADCNALVEAWTDYVGTPQTGIQGKWFDEAEAKDECTPFPDDPADVEYAGCQADSFTARNSGGLFGGAAIVNAENGTMFSYDAQALQGFDDTEDGIHFIPGTIFPSLNSGSVKTSWVFFGVPQNRAVDLTFDETVDAVSSVFMHETVMNEFTQEEVLGATTEWVVTFPTKNFYADLDRMLSVGLLEEATDDDEGDADCDVDEETGDYVNCEYSARGPFTELYGAVDSSDDALCEVVSLQTWNREEDTFVPETPGGTRPPVVSPSLPGGCDPELEVCEVTVFQLCNEVNVLRIGDGSVFGTPELEGDSLLLSVDEGFDSGWGRLDFGSDRDGDTRVLVSNDGTALVGLPVTGFSAFEFQNDFVGEGGVKANYGGLFRHKGNVRGTSARVSQLPTQ